MAGIIVPLHRKAYFAPQHRDLTANALLAYVPGLLAPLLNDAGWQSDPC
ncbi:hypothetical protein [Bradyrhizobium sp. WSM1253]|nr:hypothetical protein [Bradyrhizobium sp. WSM1253]